MGGGQLHQHVFILGLNVVGNSFHVRVFGHRVVGQRGIFTICASFDATLLFFQARLLAKSISTLVSLDGISEEAIFNRTGNSEETSDG